MSSVWRVFEECVRAVESSIPTRRSSDDKEFHFQRWVSDRIALAGFTGVDTGRNRYPDFPIESFGEAYEVKGITVGSRENDFDSNSTLPSGAHAGQVVFYIFGRYETDENSRTSVRDLVIVHGAFLNAGGGYDSKNTSMRGAGSYGDVLLRDRKMYVAYTPYGLLSHLRDHCTLIVPAGWTGRPGAMIEVGAFSRYEHAAVLTGYRASLRDGSLQGEFEPNAAAGSEHPFQAWSLSARANRVEFL